jgi:cell shape-determining protein MreC
MQRKSSFSRRLPDLVTEELVAVLSKKNTSFEFKQLFDLVHERLKARNAASGGEEMLRLRAYEKLQNLVSRGMVKKTGKKYKGLASISKALEGQPTSSSVSAPATTAAKG